MHTAGQPEHFTLTTEDGIALAASAFGPARAAAAIIICPATGVPRRFYAPLAAYLAQAGHRVLTVDYRGIGDSRPVGSLRQCRFTMSDWGQYDLEALLLHAGRGAQRVFAITHSVGGQVLPLAPSATQLEGLYTVATQSGHWRHWPSPRHALMFALWWGVIPILTPFLGYGPGRMYGGEDLPPRVIKQWARWGRHREYVFSYSETMKQRFAAIAAPGKAVSIDDDALAPRAAVDALVGHFGGDLQRVHLHPHDLNVPRLGHFGFFRRGNESVLWADILETFGLATAERAPAAG